jgi:hypothetical protein
MYFRKSENLQNLEMKIRDNEKTPKKKDPQNNKNIGVPIPRFLTIKSWRTGKHYQIQLLRLHSWGLNKLGKEMGNRKPISKKRQEESRKEANKNQNALATKPEMATKRTANKGRKEQWKKRRQQSEN